MDFFYRRRRSDACVGKLDESQQDESSSTYSRFPPIRSASSLPSISDLLMRPQRTPSQTTSKAPAKSETTPRLSDHCHAKCSEARPHRRRRHMPKIFEKYKPLNSIGKGQYGTVFVVEARSPAQLSAPLSLGDKKDSGRRRYACKIVDLAIPADVVVDDEHCLRNRILKNVVNEIETVSSIGSHPNVQDLIEFVVEDDKAYIISSLCRGGDLAQALEMRGCLCEEDAKNVMSGILNGLAHLHSRGVVHRDIKLENILLTDSKHDMSKVKIIDMGFAKHLATPHAEALNTVCGTPLYLAPELIEHTVQTGTVQSKARYGTQADMWSCGVIMYRLLSGYPPFDVAGCTNMLELFEDIQNAAYDFSDPVWETVSCDALNMLECLLEADPARRLTAEQALHDPWMTTVVTGC